MSSYEEKHKKSDSDDNAPSKVTNKAVSRCPALVRQLACKMKSIKLASNSIVWSS